MLANLIFYSLLTQFFIKEGFSFYCVNKAIEWLKVCNSLYIEMMPLLLIGKTQCKI